MHKSKYIHPNPAIEDARPYPELQAKMAKTLREENYLVIPDIDDAKEYYRYIKSFDEAFKEVYPQQPEDERTNC